MAAAPQVEALVNMDAEFSGPGWMFGTRTYQALSDGSFLAIYNDPKARNPVTFAKPFHLWQPGGGSRGVHPNETRGALLLIRRQPWPYTALTLALALALGVWIGTPP